VEISTKGLREKWVLRLNKGVGSFGRQSKEERASKI